MQGLGNQQLRPEQGKVQRLTGCGSKLLLQREGGKRLAARNGRLPIGYIVQNIQNISSGYQFDYY